MILRVDDRMLWLKTHLNRARTDTILPTFTFHILHFYILHFTFYKYMYMYMCIYIYIFY